MRRFALIAAVLTTAARAAEPITLTVDASEAPRRIFHSTLVVPVAPGELTLVYPKWIPGDHAPMGPISDVAGLYVSAAGTLIAWRRGLGDMWGIPRTRAAGAAEVVVKFDFLSPDDDGGRDGGWAHLDREA